VFLGANLGSHGHGTKTVSVPTGPHSRQGVKTTPKPTWGVRVARILRRLARWQKRFQTILIAVLSLATAWYIFEGAEMTRESNAIAREKAVIERDTAALNFKAAEANARAKPARRRGKGSHRPAAQ
jgi:hypothetical protein